MEPRDKTLHIRYRMLEARTCHNLVGIREKPCYLAGTIFVPL